MSIGVQADNSRFRNEDYPTQGDVPTQDTNRSLSGVDEEAKRLMRMHETYLQIADELEEKIGALSAEIEKTVQRRQEFIRAAERVGRAVNSLTGADEPKSQLAAQDYAMKSSGRNI